ncbi:tripartite tricarboxylate transporter TctB family protein [Clostridium sp. AM58-1XD]|uniref:tripartite tricarboxylate transporter TctB family protein n=1 Tax=Clostridium sp. AM58-1XD TaxID=2292307 RepID=UPI000E4CA0BB|nr:tripartite tricarboxylate transporter TctB family protein [Clostridium sp. AM58-1XD]RGY97256.1 tripartite tricarboxylate transporter TctB family protein [Clostridium sp. AM58-1XD]
MKGMRKCTSDIIISVVLLGFLVSLSIQMPAIPKDSRTYPMILMVLSYIMVGAQLIYNLVIYKKSEIVESQLKAQVKVIFPYAVIIVGYLALLGKIGYIFDTILFCFVSLIYLKLKNKIVMVILSVVLTLVLYFVFTRFLSVILPRGSWISLNL